MTTSPRKGCASRSCLPGAERVALVVGGGVFSIRIPGKPIRRVIADLMRGPLRLGAEAKGEQWRPAHGKWSHPNRSVTRAAFGGFADVAVGKGHGAAVITPLGRALHLHLNGAPPTAGEEPHRKEAA